MSTFFYHIPVEIGEANYLLDALCSDLPLAESEWSLDQEPMTNEVSILVQVNRPLSLNERRKIVSCGLTIHLVGVE